MCISLVETTTRSLMVVQNTHARVYVYIRIYITMAALSIKSFNKK